MKINLEIPEETIGGELRVECQWLLNFTRQLYGTEETTIELLWDMFNIEESILKLAKMSEEAASIEKFEYRDLGMVTREISRVFIGKRGNASIFECTVILDDGRIGTAWCESYITSGGLNYFSGYLDKKPEIDKA